MLELTTMVRALVGDLDETDQEFSDDRVATAIVVAALQVSRELPLSLDYKFDIIGLQVEPDPYAENDIDTVALITLKAACILNQNQYQAALGSGISVREGSSQVDTTGSFGGYRDIIKNGPCAAYQSLLQRLSLAKSQAGVARGVSRIRTYSDTRFWFDSYLQTLVPVPNNYGP